MKKTIKWLAEVLLVVAMATAGSQAISGVNVFTPTGPDGGFCYDVEFAAGGVLLATTTRGVYRSTDNGANWTRTLGTGTWAPMRLAVNPANRNTVLFAGPALSRSTDGGSTWTTVANLPDLATNPAGFVEFSADGSTAWLTQQNGGTIFRSTDGGATWTAIVTGMTNAIYWLEVDATNPLLIYGRTANGAFRSTDGGSTFTKMPFTPYVWTHAASRTTHNTALAMSSDDNRLYFTADGGVTWSPRPWSPAGAHRIEFLQYVPGTAGHALAMDDQSRLLRTLDDGQSFSDLGRVPNGRIEGMAFDPANSDHVVVASHGGIFVSSDGAATWAERNKGLREGNVRQAIVSRAGAGAVYLLTGDLASVYRRDAMAGTWEARAAASTPLLGYSAALGSISGYYALAAAPQDANLLYMVRDRHFGVSADAGATWTARPDTPVFVDAVAVSPSNSQVVYVGARNSWPLRSNDGGATWADLSAAGLPVGVRFFAFDPVNPAIVYAAVDNYLPPAASPVYKSVDGGTTFNPTPWDTTDNASIVWRLVHDPVRSGILYLSSYIGVFRSADGGATWVRSPIFASGQTSAGAQDLVVDPQSADIVYASSYQRAQIARSVNAGVDWDTFTVDPELNGFNTLALVPGTKTKIIAARWNGSVEIDIVSNLSVTSASASPVAGTAASTVVTVTNNSDFAVSTVRLTATLPASSSTSTAQASAGACTITGAALACDIGILSRRASANVTIGYTPTAAGPWSATASAYEPEESTVNNTLTVNVTAPPSGGGSSGGGGGGGGGRLDYLLLALLSAGALARGRRRRIQKALMPVNSRPIVSW